MLSFSGSVKVLVALEPCDLRKGFNGLEGLVSQRLGVSLVLPTNPDSPVR